MLNSKRKELKKKLDILWPQIIKAQAGGACELCGGTDGLDAHHIEKKLNDLLRYELRNGICLDHRCHRNGCHSSDANVQKEFKEKITMLRGVEVMQWLASQHRSMIKYTIFDLEIMVESFTGILKNLQR